MTQKNNSDNKITKTIKTGFVSEIDQFFHNFDKNRASLPASRLEEIRKYKVITYKRDHS